jgi:hypothetical protein
MEALLAVERELDGELCTTGGGDSPALSPQKLPSALVDGVEGAAGDPASPEPSDEDDGASEGGEPGGAGAGADAACAAEGAGAGDADAALPFHADKKKLSTLKKLKKLFKPSGSKAPKAKGGAGAGAVAADTQQEGGGEPPAPRRRSGAGAAAAAGPFAAAQQEERAALERQPSSQSAASSQQQQQPGRSRSRRPGSDAGRGGGSGSAAAGPDDAGDDGATSSAGALVPYWSTPAAAGPPSSAATPLPPYPPSRYSSGRFELGGSGRHDSAGLGGDDGSSVISGYDARMGTVGSSAAGGSRSGTIKGLLGPRKKRNKQIELDALRCAALHGLCAWRQLPAACVCMLGRSPSRAHDPHAGSATAPAEPRLTSPPQPHPTPRPAPPTHPRPPTPSSPSMEMEMLQERCSAAENGLSTASHDVSALRADRDALQQQVRRQGAWAGPGAAHAGLRGDAIAGGACFGRALLIHWVMGGCPR